MTLRSVPALSFHFIAVKKETENGFFPHYFVNSRMYPKGGLQSFFLWLLGRDGAPPPQDKCLGGKGLLLWSSVENVGVAMEVTLS